LSGGVPQRQRGTNWVSFLPCQILRCLPQPTAQCLPQPFHLLLSKMQPEQFAAEILGVTAAISIGFSLQKGDRVQIATELTVATGFFAGAHP
jgi:hypothetical protein